jgi:hypothetical protein
MLLMVGMMLWIRPSRDWGLQFLGLLRYSREDLPLRRLGVLRPWPLCMPSHLLIQTRRRRLRLKLSRGYVLSVHLWRLRLLVWLPLVCRRMLFVWLSMRFPLFLFCLPVLLGTGFAWAGQLEDVCALSPVPHLRRQDELRLPRLHVWERSTEFVPRRPPLGRVRERRGSEGDLLHPYPLARRHHHLAGGI